MKPLLFLLSLLCAEFTSAYAQKTTTQPAFSNAINIPGSDIDYNLEIISDDHNIILTGYKKDSYFIQGLDENLAVKKLTSNKLAIDGEKTDIIKFIMTEAGMQIIGLTRDNKVVLVPVSTDQEIMEDKVQILLTDSKGDYRNIEVLISPNEQYYAIVWNEPNLHSKVHMKPVILNYKNEVQWKKEFHLGYENYQYTSPRFYISDDGVFCSTAYTTDQKIAAGGYTVDYTIFWADNTSSALNKFTFNRKKIDFINPYGALLTDKKFILAGQAYTIDGADSYNMASAILDLQGDKIETYAKNSLSIDEMRKQHIITIVNKKEATVSEFEPRFFKQDEKGNFYYIGRSSGTHVTAVIDEDLNTIQATITPNNQAYAGDALKMDKYGNISAVMIDNTVYSFYNHMPANIGLDYTDQTRLKFPESSIVMDIVTNDELTTQALFKNDEKIIFIPTAIKAQGSKILLLASDISKQHLKIGTIETKK